MKELDEIVTAAEQARAAGKRAALATVVGIEGSAYRLPGARMLITDGRWTAGSISGGCLEDDVVLRAGQAIEKGEALLATYDTTSDDDIVFGVGLGCKGVITILIEPLQPERDGADFMGFAKSCLESRTAGTAATIVRVQGQVRAEPGHRMLVSANADTTDIGDVELQARVRDALKRLSFSQGPLLTSIALSQGSVDVFLERVEPPTPLLVFGAGHDAIPVVGMAKVLGWQVTVVDHRPAYAMTARFPLASRVIRAATEEVLSHVDVTEDTLAVVMTHNYLRDLKLLEILLPLPMRYLGLLGPRKRTDQMLADLKARGITPTPDQLGRLYTPVGLDLGSETPAEVALSMLAEMQAVLANRPGSSLRERNAPIHNR
ncbi:MAG: XdhC family protein [Burkholderiales bacterium]|nr:XdhC family protein [Burkholderiales bacterium]